MDSFDMTSASETSSWLLFLAILLVVGIAVFCFVIWLMVIRRSGGKISHKHHKRRKRRHRRQNNPTLAQTGGLPPVRDPNQPPRGV